MAQVSGMSFSGLDHLNTIFESGNNYLWNSWAADDAQDRAKENAAYQSQLSKELAAYNAQLNYDYYIAGLKQSPSAYVSGLEAAGLNPILAANSSAGSFSAGANASVGSLSSPVLGDGGHGSGGASAGDPLMMSKGRLQLAQQRATVAHSTAAAEAQHNLAELYKAQAKRTRFVPLTESDNGGLSILGTGFNTGGTDTLLFDTETGQLVRPKDAPSSNSAKSSGTVEVLFDYDRDKIQQHQKGGQDSYKTFNLPR